MAERMWPHYCIWPVTGCKIHEEWETDAGAQIAGYFDEGVRGYGGQPYFDGILYNERDGIFWRCMHGHVDVDTAEACAQDSLQQWGLAELRSQGERWS